MGVKLTNLLNCEEKEPDYDDSDEDGDNKLSNASIKTVDKTLNLNEMTPKPPPNTTKECNFRTECKNHSIEGLLKNANEPENNENNEKKVVSVKKLDENYKNDKKMSKKKKKKKNDFLEIIGISPEYRQTAKFKINYNDFQMKTTEKNDENILPNQIFEEKKEKFIEKETILENDEEFQRIH